MKGVFDTNILIDYLNGIDAARQEFTKYNTKIISMITWMEVLVGVLPNTDEDKTVRDFLYQFKLIALDQEIASIAMGLRQKKRIKLPDAIIWATALKENSILITRNTKDFPSHDPSIRIPYQ